MEPTKCKFLEPELQYLGHLITADGRKPNPVKIEAIQNFKKLENVKDYKSFLGLAGYYRKFIKNFSSIAKPLMKLTQKDIIFDWTPNFEKAFYDLKHALTTAPVLKFPNFKEQFVLTTDVSNQGPGAVLSQNGHPYLFISRTLNKAEGNYKNSEKELLATVWATKRLRQYLLGNKFKIQTDHRALVWLHNVKDPSSRLLRWRLRLEEYDYEIEFVKGKENKVADCLSRLFPVYPDTTKQSKDNADSTPKQLENALPDTEISHSPVITRDELLAPENRIKLPTRRMREPSEDPEVQKVNTLLFDQFMQWRLQPIKSDKIKIKPNAIAKLWKEITNQDLPVIDEEEWLKKFETLIENSIEKKRSITRLIIGDLPITPIQKEFIQELIEFLSTIYPEQNLHLCFNNTRELRALHKRTLKFVWLRHWTRLLHTLSARQIEVKFKFHAGNLMIMHNSGIYETFEGYTANSITPNYKSVRENFAIDNAQSRK